MDKKEIINKKLNVYYIGGIRYEIPAQVQEVICGELSALQAEVERYREGYARLIQLAHTLNFRGKQKIADDIMVIINEVLATADHRE